MSDIKREEIEKIIERLREFAERCEEHDAEYWAGKANAYRQSARILREVLEEESLNPPDSPDPGGLY